MLVDVFCDKTSSNLLTWYANSESSLICYICHTNPICESYINFNLVGFRNEYYAKY